MFKLFANFIVLLLCTAFIAPTFATIVSVESQMHTENPVNHTSLFADQQAQSETQSSDEECCQIECVDARCLCFENACTLIVYLISHKSYANNSFTSEIIHYKNSPSPTTFLAVLYRPPIYFS